MGVVILDAEQSAHAKHRGIGTRDSQEVAGPFDFAIGMTWVTHIHPNVSSFTSYCNPTVCTCSKWPQYHWFHAKESKRGNFQEPPWCTVPLSTRCVADLFPAPTYGWDHPLSIGRFFLEHSADTPYMVPCLL